MASNPQAVGVASQASASVKINCRSMPASDHRPGNSQENGFKTIIDDVCLQAGESPRKLFQRHRCLLAHNDFPYRCYGHCSVAHRWQSDAVYFYRLA